MTPVLLLFVFCIFCLVFLLVGLVFPEFFYDIRSAVIRVKMAKVFYDIYEGKNPSEELYKELRLADIRAEFSRIATGNGRSYATDRIRLLRERYSSFAREIPKMPHLAEKYKPQLCITEAANLVSWLSKRLVVIAEDQPKPVGAEELLKFIYDSYQAKTGAEGESGTGSGDPVIKWLRDNPMSVEQIMEILITVLYGLTYRLEAQEKK
jgi:hypothetical protein